MLIEASKGGHIAVVQLLLDYPNSIDQQGTQNQPALQQNLPQLQQSPAQQSPSQQPQQQQPLQITILEPNPQQQQQQQQPQLPQQQPQELLQLQSVAERADFKMVDKPNSQILANLPSPIQMEPNQQVPNLLDGPKPIDIGDLVEKSEQHTICSTQVCPVAGLQEVPNRAKNPTPTGNSKIKSKQSRQTESSDGDSNESDSKASLQTQVSDRNSRGSVPSDGSNQSELVPYRPAFVSNMNTPVASGSGSRNLSKLQKTDSESKESTQTSDSCDRNSRGSNQSGDSNQSELEPYHPTFDSRMKSPIASGSGIKQSNPNANSDNSDQTASSGRNSRGSLPSAGPSNESELIPYQPTFDAPMKSAIASGSGIQIGSDIDSRYPTQSEYSDSSDCELIIPKHLLFDSHVQSLVNTAFVASQQIFQHQVQSNDPAVPNSMQNIIINSNVKNSPVDLQDSILANMRFLRNQGFKDGLALGLARFGLVNNNNNNQANNMSEIITSPPQQMALPMPSTTAGCTGVGQTNAVKQKSLLRKNRQAPTPFEMNVHPGSTSSESSQNRLQQFGGDASKAFGAVASGDKPGFLEDFKLVSGKMVLMESNCVCNETLTISFFCSWKRRNYNRYSPNRILRTRFPS